MTIAIHWDKEWGGFYIHKGYASRIALGYIAITIVPIPFDELLKGYVKGANER